MNKDKVGAIYEVDLECKRQLYALHKDEPLAPKHYEYKLCTSLQNNTNYVVHYINLEFDLKRGLVQKRT